MSYENPTRLRLGMHGNFAGKDYCLVGRVVMGETEDGETYYWNEFNLEADGGGNADLVYEEAEHGGEWRLFTMFEPECPITAADAATKRVGDRINLTGEDVRITVRSSSRVYHIEGRAPEGVELGDVANYFNAQAGNDMQVVSWTGDEVECYNGVTIPQSVIAVAFNVPRASDSSPFSGSGSASGLGGNTNNYNGFAKVFLQAALVIFLLIIVFGRNVSCSTDHVSAPVKRIPAAAPMLTVGATGKLADKDYRITAHAVVEIAEVNSIYGRNEYELTDDSGVLALLVCGERPDSKDWTLFTPLAPLPPPPPQQAAAQKVGDSVNVDGFVATVNDLFQSSVQSVDSVAPATWRKGDMSFGYSARSGNGLLLARWNKVGMNFYQGKTVFSKDIITTFSVTNGR